MTPNISFEIEKNEHIKITIIQNDINTKLVINLNEWKLDYSVSDQYQFLLKVKNDLTTVSKEERHKLHFKYHTNFNMMTYIIFNKYNVTISTQRLCKCDVLCDDLKITIPLNCCLDNLIKFVEDMCEIYTCSNQLSPKIKCTSKKIKINKKKKNKTHIMAIPRYLMTP